MKNKQDFKKSKFRITGICLNSSQNLSEHSPESAGTFPGIFNDILHNLIFSSIGAIKAPKMQRDLFCFCVQTD